MAGLSEIAKHCGISLSTVSRALNGKEGVSDSLRAKIIAASYKLGYDHSDKIKSQQIQDKSQIGLILPDITSPFYAAIAKGVCDYLRPLGYVVILCNAARQRDEEALNIRMLETQQVAGVVVISVTAKEKDFLPLQQKGIRVVAADVELGPSFSSVVNDNYRGAVLLFEHMIETCGCRKIGCILGEKSAQTTVDRLKALQEVLEKNKLPFDESKILYTQATFELGYKKTKQLLSKDIDAIFAINDMVALGVIKYCQDHQVKIPEDIKVAGYDDLEIGSMISVPLTTVHQRKVLLGRKAAELLLQEIKEHSDPIKIVLAPKLTIRSSCGEKLE